jgi:hypothetical protein
VLFEQPPTSRQLRDEKITGGDRYGIQKNAFSGRRDYQPSAYDGLLGLGLRDNFARKSVVE